MISNLPTCIPHHSFSKHTYSSMAILPNPHQKRRSFVVNWSNIPKELLELIFEYVRYDGNYIRVHAVRDLIRINVVCKSWQSSLVSIRKQIGPLILLPPNTQKKKNEDLYHLFDFSKNKAHKIQLPEICDKWICNSSNGWLVTINCTPPYNQIHLLNPFSKIQIELPPPSTFEDRPPPVDETPIECFIVKAVVSSPSDPNCNVMAIYSVYEKLAFCKSGDTNWRTLKGTEDHYRNIIYYKGDFYAIGMSGNLVLCDITSPEPKAIMFAPMRGSRSTQTYLVESSSGDLLKIDRDLAWDDISHFTENFEVFKLNFREKKWELVNSLGDNSIFVGHNVSILISAEKFPIRRDCIYFIDDHWEGYFKRENGCHDMGVFDLKTKLIEPTFQFSKPWPYPLFWVAPDSTSLACMNMNAWKTLKL